MKLKLLALLVIAILPLMAFDCITDPSSITISLNLAPFNASYGLNSGSSKTYGGSVAIDPTSLYDQSYTLTGASVYDITVATKGPDDLGNGGGSVSVNGVLLFTYAGSWNQFKTPQSLLTSTLITRNPAGVATLIAAVTGKRMVTFTVNGTITNTPSASNVDFLVVAAYVQAYGHR